MLEVCDRYSMALPDVRDLPVRDFEYMLAYCYKHPTGSRAESYYWGHLLSVLVNKDIDRDKYPEGLKPTDLVSWLNQEIPDYLLTPEEIQTKEDAINKEMAEQLKKDFG